jgi:hypothetical protein
VRTAAACSRVPRCSRAAMSRLSREMPHAVGFLAEFMDDVLNVPHDMQAMDLCAGVAAAVGAALRQVRPCRPVTRAGGLTRSGPERDCARAGPVHVLTAQACDKGSEPASLVLVALLSRMLCRGSALRSRWPPPKSCRSRAW